VRRRSGTKIRSTSRRKPLSERLVLWAIVIGYMAFVFVKGVLKARKVGNADDFLVAGRDVKWFFLFCTMGATVIGGGASIGAIGRTYDWGVLMLLVSTGWYLHFIFSGLVVAPQFREAELYTVAGYFGHRFGEGPRFVMLILSLLFSVFIVAAQMAAFGSVLAAIMPGFADVEMVLRLAILIGGAMVVIYSTAGGLLAVIHTDVYQFIVLIVGFVVTLSFCVPDIADSYNPNTGTFIPTRFAPADIEDAHGLAAAIREGDGPLSEYVRSAMPAKSLERLERSAERPAALKDRKRILVTALNRLVKDPDLYSEKRFESVKLTPQTEELLSFGSARERDLERMNLSLLQDAYSGEISRNRSIPARFFQLDGGKGWVFLITTFFAFLLGETFAPGYATRYCVGKNTSHTRRGIAGVGFFLAFTFPVVLFFIALYARIHYPDIEPQQALPMVVRQLNNPLIGGLIIGALLMAVMSSADSALNSSTAIFVKDLFEHQLGWKDRGDGRMLKLARICSAALGAAAIVVAILWSDIIGLLLFTYHVWAPAVILPVCVGALTKRRSSALTKNILITMLAATAATMAYRFIGFLESTYGVAPFGERVHEFMARFDPSVFGVLCSCVVFAATAAVSGFGERDPETGPGGSAGPAGQAGTPRS
jgi:Na+/proline symporter